MTSRRLIILILLALYILAIGALTVYHAFNFTDYVHSKGDETINYTFFLLLTSILFQGLVWIIAGKLDWKAAALGTIGNFMSSYVMGVVILMVSGLSGIPKHLIFVYGGCFLTFFVIVTVLQSNRLTTRIE